MNKTLSSLVVVALAFGSAFADVGYSHLYEYLESDGTQLVDLGVKMQKRTMVDLYFQPVVVNKAQKFFGALNGTAGASIGNAANIKFSANWYGTYTPAVSIGVTTRARMQVQTAYVSKGGYQFTASQINGFTGFHNEGGSPYIYISAQDLNYYAFGVNVKDGDPLKGKVRIERIVISSDGGERLHDFRAAMKDGVLGLYDLVTDAFCANIADGANDFTAGPETVTAADALQIETDPANLCFGPGQTFSAQTGLEPGDEIDVSAPEIDEPRLRAACTGWTLYSLKDGKWIEDTTRENHSGTGKTFTYVHTDCATRLVWHYALSDPGKTSEESVKYVWLGSGSDANDGSSWSAPFATVQAAQNAATYAGETVLVGPAHYDLASEITLSDNLSLVSACGATKTVLDRNSIGRTLSVPSGTKAAGFTVTGGKGVYDGGGIYLQYGTVQSCIVSNNTAAAGAGVRTWGGLLENSLICENECSNQGGGVFVYHGALVRHCTIANNSAANGGGIYYNALGDKAHDLIVWGNTANSNPDINDAGSSNFATWTNICTSIAVGVNPQTADPIFKNVANHDYRLAGSSPYRDAAWCLSSLPKDVLGNARVQNGLMDVGAIESDPNEMSANMEYEITGGLDTASVSFVAKGTNFDIEEADCYWTFDGRTPSASDHDATGSSLSHDYTEAGTYSVALAVVYDGETFYDTKEDFLTVAPSQIYVDANCTKPTYPYNTPGKAANGLAEAVEAAASSGSAITVKPGTYVFPAQVVIKKQVRILSEQGPEVTIFDGAGKVALLNPQVDGTVIAGFTLCNGKGAGDQPVAVKMQAGVLTNCVVCGMTGGSGVGVWGSALVTGCVISNNTNGSSVPRGGGVYTWGGILENSLVCDNTATEGGGVHVYHGALVRHCTIVNNEATSIGGGIYYNSGTSDKDRAHDTIVWGNTAATAPDINDPGADSFAGWTNICSSVEVGVNVSKNDLVGDPLFENAAAGDYRLRVQSRCRNAAWGRPSASVDLVGNPRQHGRRVDIGCYECQTGPGLLMIVR